jgi:hypothetical protein
MSRFVLRADCQEAARQRTLDLPKEAQWACRIQNMTIALYVLRSHVVANAAGRSPKQLHLSEPLGLRKCKCCVAHGLGLVYVNTRSLPLRPSIINNSNEYTAGAIDLLGNCGIDYGE